ncbi:MAG: single-stranded-DNA-specific exonuclease RecJ, partial [bacterium]
MTDYTRREIPNEKDPGNLAKYSELTQTLLLARGINTAEAAEVFFAPEYERDLHDPFLMKGMDKTVKRILKAIDKKEKIVIYSDYDADGVPGGAVLYDFFKKIGYTNFSNYIPHRHLEGFGLNLEAVEEFEKDKVDLVITVDCGITDVEEADRLKEHKIDLIVTDHHLPGEKLPKAVAILDAKQTDCEYPNKNICGAGVAFKLVQALIKSRDFGLKAGWEKWLLDLVGIATVSDMVALTGENRALAYFGLKVLRKTPRPGLRKLFQRLKIDPENITEDDIGFSIAPRINAASRLGDPEDAFKLLVAGSEVEGDRAAELLEKLNTERKSLVAVLSKEVKKIIEERYSGNSRRSVIVIGRPDWRPGLLGLAANAVLDYHEGAVFLWGREGGETGLLKGSCRSNGVSVVELMKRVPKEVLADFGGHSVSGGFSISSETVHKLE